MSRTLRCFCGFLRQQYHALVGYRLEMVLKIAYSLLAMYGAKCLWTALYKQSPDIVGRPLPAMITYAMLGMVLDIIFYPSGDNTVANYIDQQMKNGRIDTDLLKPLPFQRMMLLRNSSLVLTQGVLLVLPACILAMVCFDFQMPDSALRGILFLISLILAYLILFSLNFLIGMICIYTLNITHIRWAYNGVISLLSGKLVPLWLFPAWLEKGVHYLPFRAIYDIPLGIYIGTYQGSSLVQELLFQVVWSVALFLIGKQVWSAARHRLVVQGG